MWVDGRETRIQKTNRPELIRPEEWERLSKKQKAKAKRESDLEVAHREVERKNRGILKLEEQDYPEYDRCLAKAKLELCVPPAPEMPTFTNNPMFQAGL